MTLILTSEWSLLYVYVRRVVLARLWRWWSSMWRTWRGCTPRSTLSCWSWEKRSCRTRGRLDHKPKEVGSRDWYCFTFSIFNLTVAALIMHCHVISFLSRTKVSVSVVASAVLYVCVYIVCNMYMLSDCRHKSRGNHTVPLSRWFPWQKAADITVLQGRTLTIAGLDNNCYIKNWMLILILIQ